MQKIMKKQDGISLVALIITIIVMVILAGVIITAAVADGGIIDRAKISMIEKERAEIEEITKASYVIKKFASSTNSFSYLDLNQTADAIYENLTLNGFTVTNATEEGKIPVNTDPVTGEETGIDLNVKGDHGEYKGEVGPSGIVGEIEVVEPETPEDSGEIDNPEGTETPEVTEELWEDIGNGKISNGKETVEIGKTTFSNEEVLEKLNITDNTGSYQGDWVVIGVKSGKLKVATVKNVSNSNIILGKSDPTVVLDEIVDINDDKNLDFEKAVWSQKNCVNTVNQVAKQCTGITNARSINLKDIENILGEENINKGDYGTLYHYYFIANTVNTIYKEKVIKINEDGSYVWQNDGSIGIYASYKGKDAAFIDDSGEVVIINENNSKANAYVTCTTMNHNMTPEQKESLGKLLGEDFYLANRSNGTNNGILEVNSSQIWYRSFFAAQGYLKPGYTYSGVRAVVVLGEDE